MIDLSGFFQLDPLPANAMVGSYSISLVILSYCIAVFASYLALDFADRLQREVKSNVKWYWSMGGVFSMGAGIWSMHFIGMLAYMMPMPMAYDSLWTILSFVVVIICAGIAVFFLRDEKRGPWYLAIGGIFLGVGVASMHYLGMAGMVGVHVHYLPGLFILSIVIAIVASEIALWFVIRSHRGPLNKTNHLKIMSAFIMGAAICGMHYTGMASAVITPASTIHIMQGIHPFSLALFIAVVTGSILLIGLIVSTYKRIMISSAQNEKDFLNAVLNNLSDGVLACDPTGKNIVVNSMLKQMLNLKNSDFLNKKWTNIFYLYHVNKEEPICLSFLILRTINGEKFEAEEFELRLKNNDYRRSVCISGQPILNVDGEKLGAVIVIHDLTARKLAENKFQNILKAAPDAMIIINDAGHIVFTNAQVKKIFGYTWDELDGKAIEMLIPARYRKPHADHRDHYFGDPHVRPMGSNLDLYGLHKNGYEFPVEISLSPLETEEGVLGLAAVRDISESKKAKELEALNKELEEFASITSHDLRAPLRAIQKLSSWIEEDSYDSLNEESKKHFDLLKKRTQRMERLIEGILHYSRVGQKKIELSEVNVQQLLDDIILSLNLPSDTVIDIGQMPIIITPEILLRQVFSNLISNGIKHNKKENSTIKITCSLLDHYYQFCVEDNGPGIPKEFQDKIFIIYQTLNSQDETDTAGIGLAIVKKAVGRVNGRVWVDSEEGHGSKFFFTWPATVY